MGGTQSSFFLSRQSTVSQAAETSRCTDAMTCTARHQSCCTADLAGLRFSRAERRGTCMFLQQARLVILQLVGLVCSESSTAAVLVAAQRPVFFFTCLCPLS